MADYIPSTDPEFDLWQKSLMDKIRELMPILGIDPNKAMGLDSKQSIWNTTFSKASNKQNRTRLQKYKPKKMRSTTTKEFVVSWLNFWQQQQSIRRPHLIGLAVKSGTRTPAPVPSTSPLGTVDFSVRLQHTLHLSDQATPQAKPNPPVCMVAKCG